MVYYERTISKAGTVKINHRIYQCKNIPDELIGRRMVFGMDSYKFVTLFKDGGYEPEVECGIWPYSHNDDGSVTLFSSDGEDKPCAR